MKRKFTFLIAAMALIFAMMTPREAWGQNQSVTMAYSGSATTNMTSGNNAASVGLDASHWNVAADKGGNNNFPGLNKAGQIRLYGSSSNHNVITVTNSDNATITSITVTYGSSNYNAKVTVGGVVVTGTGPNTEKTYSINNSSFSIAHNYSSTTQVYIVSIVINYSSQTLTSIAVQTPPTKTTYNVDETFDPTGLVIKATYDTGDPEDITYAGNENKFTFNPGLTTALTKVNNKVTITYGEKSVDQEITVNLNKLATPTHLNATPASTSATLTWDAVANASSYDVKLNGETKTTETNSLLVENLTASTTYTWTVKAIGDGTTYADSDESLENEFTTLAPPSVAYTVAFSGNGHGNPAIGSIPEAEAGVGVTLPNCTPNAGYQFVGWATTNTATEADAGVAGATYHPTANITLYAVYNSVYTITWSVNGAPTTDGNPTTSVVEGEGITTLPTAPASISGMAFQGWTATQIETPSTTAPTDLFTDAEHAPAITANTTFYAVFAEESEGDVTWNNVTTLAGITEGEYVIINGGFYLPSTTTSSSPTTVAAPTILNKTIADENVTAAMKWSFTISENAVTIKNASANYLYTTSSNTGVRVGNTSATWTFTLKDNGYFSMKCSTNRFCAVAPDYNDWRSYTTDNADNYKGNGVKIELYKKTQDITYTYYTNVVEKQLESISLSGEYPTEFWKGEAFSHDGMMVTAHYENADDEDVTSKAEFSTPDMSTVGVKTVTVSYETASKTYDITVKTIANNAETAYTVEEAIAIIDANPAELTTENVYVKGTVSKIVTAYSSDFGNITFDVSADGQTTGDQFQFYRNFKDAGNTHWASAAECPAVGDDVIGYGMMQKHNSTYEFGAGNYLVSHIRVATLSIGDITVELGGTIAPVIETNVPEAERSIEYTVPSENVVKVNEDGKLVTVAVGGPVEVTATLTAEGYKSAETTFKVTVIKALEFIAVKEHPTTLEYKEGDKFNPAGLVITANYNDESTEDVAYAGNEDKFTFTPSLETPLTIGNTSVTITYAGKETTQDISVRALYTYNITWKANGKQFTTTQVTEGNTLGTLPTLANDNIPNGYTFKGWSENEVALTNAEPTYITAETVPTGDMTLKAVFAMGETSGENALVKMVAGNTLNNGDKIVIVAHETTVALYQETVSNSYVNIYTFDNNFATIMGDDKNWLTVSTAEGGFTLGDATNGYLYSSGNNLYIGGTAQTWTLSDLADGTFKIQSDGRNLSYRHDLTNQYWRMGGANYGTSGQTVLGIYKISTSSTTYSNFCTTVNPISGNLAYATTVANTAYYISEAATVEGEVTINGVLGNANASLLIIKDGGQLIFNNSSSKDNNINSGVKATVEKNIVPYGSGKGDKGWHFLAAPMEDFAVTSFTDQANGNYDLYRWRIIDGTPTWYNYKYHHEEPYNEELGTGFETNFLSGRGYLAAYETTNLLQMQGTLNAGTEFEFTDELNGEGHFTLLGNPFTYDLNWSEFNNKTGIYDGFAVVGSKDGIIKYDVGDKTIKVGTGFMVYTEEEEGAKLSFKKGNGSVKSNDILALNLFASNGNGEDNTIIVLDDNNGGFAKADNFNTNVPQIYTERLQTKYGIRNFSTSTKEFNVSFKAAGEGSNTIRLETIGEFDYVHLYDKLLDVDVDMLLEGSYTFEASEDDDTHRFIVRIDKGNTGIDENETENFVNVYNGEIHVSGSGEVQIFDVMGRIVHSEVISGDATISTGGFKGGVYVVRLIGNGWTKTEKIVVRR